MKSLLKITTFLALCSQAQANDTLGISLGELHNDPYHFSTATPEGWEKVSYMNAGYARFDIPWSSMEWRPAGVYALNAEKAGWITLAHAQGLKCVVIVLAGGSSVYSPPVDVYPNPFDPTGYSNACAWLAKTYLTAGDVIEVLNEPNNGYPGFSGATATAAAEQSLVTFTSTTTAAVHSAAPGIKVIGLGAQGGEILAMLAMNPLIDGVVDHPYANGSNNWPETTYEPPYTDYDQWEAALAAALPSGVQVWDTEFAENNGSDAYTRTSFLTRRWLMSLHDGVKHWFPHALVLNGSNLQQFLEWNALNPRMSYYSIANIFAPGSIFTGVSPVAAPPTVTGASTAKTFKAYTYASPGSTLVGLWYSGNNITGYLIEHADPVTVSVATGLTNVKGSYAMNLVSGALIPVTATLSGGVATVTGVNISNEAQVIVLAPGVSTGPLTYTNWLSHFHWKLIQYAGVGPTAEIEAYIKANPITPDP